MRAFFICSYLNLGTRKQRAIRLGIDEAIGIIDTMLSSRANAFRSLKYRGLNVFTKGYCMLPIMVKANSVSSFLCSVTIFKVSL